ncbi:MAG: UDP-N-acetylmuramate dehydrogenase [Pyrinomonadaceae bacterium]
MNFIVQENVPLAEMTTLKIGGKARFFASAKNETEIVEALNYAAINQLEVFILGGGSNVLIADEGFDGLVLQIALKGISIFQDDKQIVCVTAQAGEDWDAFCKFCVGRNLQGIECLSGIPGFVGGTPVQNVGAYGQEVSETIRSVRVYDRTENQFKILTNDECGFNYRTSIFNTAEKNRYIVTCVNYALKKNGEPEIIYRDLQNFFGERKPTLKETREAVLKIRAAKSMVIDAHDPNSRSAGSFFKNPIVDLKKFSEIEMKARTLGVIGEGIPRFDVDENSVKIPAAWLIEKSGFEKGFHLGEAGLSSRHILAIVNRGNARAKDVLALKDKIQSKVKNRFDIELKPEPIFVGFQ